jgi:SAM-dependent methyltransferase
MSNLENRQSAWEDSYDRGENHVFQPCDEVVRFVSRFLRRRISINMIIDVVEGQGKLRVLDLGCGIGRNLVFGIQMGLEMYGIELSEKAVLKAKEFVSTTQDTGGVKRVHQGDARHLPWERGFFDHALSDSVLDSMPFVVAQEAVREVARTLKPGSLFYLNLIAKVPLGGATSLDEEVVSTKHEQGTIQSYFDFAKIKQLLGDGFSVAGCELHRVDDEQGRTLRGRWHVIAKRN